MDDKFKQPQSCTIPNIDEREWNFEPLRVRFKQKERESKNFNVKLKE